MKAFPSPSRSGLSVSSRAPPARSSRSSKAQRPCASPTSPSAARRSGRRGAALHGGRGAPRVQVPEEDAGEFGPRYDDASGARQQVRQRSGRPGRGLRRWQHRQRRRLQPEVPARRGARDRRRLPGQSIVVWRGFPVVLSGSTQGYRSATTTSCFDSGGPDRFYAIQPDADGFLTIGGSFAPGFNAIVEVRRDTCPTSSGAALCEDTLSRPFQRVIPVEAARSTTSSSTEIRRVVVRTR